jgi:hypothetical protein
MEYPFYQFLKRFEEKHGDIGHTNNESNTKAAVCIEGTNRWFFPIVVRNFKYFLGDDWNFHIFHTRYNEQFVKESLQGFEAKCYIVDSPRIDVPVYNQIMKQLQFWNAFKEDYVLIFEADTVCCKPFEDRWLDWDMIGAPCGRDGRIYNGGLSLRKRAVMVEAINKYGWHIQAEQEDEFFTIALDIMNAKIPNGYIASQFAVENWYHSQPFGFHGTTKSYIAPTLMQKIVDQIEY